MRGSQKKISLLAKAYDYFLLNQKDAGGPLEADFLQFYHKDYRDFLEADRRLSYRLLNLISQLPPNSRFKESLGADFSHRDQLLVSIDHALRILVWAKTEDAEKKRNFPEPNLPTHVREIIEELKETEKQPISGDESFNIYCYIYGEEQAKKMINNKIAFGDNDE